MEQNKNNYQSDQTTSPFKKGEVVIVRITGRKGIIIRELELEDGDDDADYRYLVRLEEHILRQFLDCELDTLVSK